MDNLTPKKIVEELDKYIIGQKNAKKAVAIALRNRWRRQLLTDELKEKVHSLIQTYESVRCFSNFDPNHCPIIELQTVGNKHYFRLWFC